MKKLLTVAALLLIASPALAGNTFVNGDFETGDLSGWTGGGGSWYGGGYPVNPSVYTGGTPNNTLMDKTVNPTDPITGLSTVYGGRYSVRANDSINNYSVSTISQSVKNYTDSHIYFAWQAVLESSHNLTDSDYFSLTLHDDTTGTDIVSRQYSSASAPGTFHTAALNSWWWTNGWTTEDVDLTLLSAVGHDFTLTLLASDCPYGGHAGYVYLDGFGAAPPQTPEPATILLFGAGLAGLAVVRRRKVNN
jgi:hypothetical protein